MPQPRPTISTHVLDLELGHPAVGVPVALFRLAEDGQPELLAELETDADGRIGARCGLTLLRQSQKMALEIMPEEIPDPVTKAGNTMNG